MNEKFLNLIKETQTEINDILGQYDFTESLTEDELSEIRQLFIGWGENPDHHNVVRMMIFWQTLVTGGKYDVSNVQKLGWDYDNKETDDEQYKFTKVISEGLINSSLLEQNPAKACASAAQDRAENVYRCFDEEQVNSKFPTIH